jgi:hypothetical protein
MDKQLKTGLSIAIAGIGGYLLYKNWTKLYPSAVVPEVSGTPIDTPAVGAPTITTLPNTGTTPVTSSSFTGVPGARKKNATASTFAVPPSPGRDPLKSVGRRRRNCGGGSDFNKASDSIFASANGTKKNITDIISTRSSGWVRGADGNVTKPNFFQPMDSGWVKLIG